MANKKRPYNKIHNSEINNNHRIRAHWAGFTDNSSSIVMDKSWHLNKGVFYTEQAMLPKDWKKMK